MAGGRVLKGWPDAPAGMHRGRDDMARPFRACTGGVGALAGVLDGTGAALVLARPICARVSGVGALAGRTDGAGEVLAADGWAAGLIVLRAHGCPGLKGSEYSSPGVLSVGGGGPAAPLARPQLPGADRDADSDKACATLARMGSERGRREKQGRGGGGGGGAGRGGGGGGRRELGDGGGRLANLLLKVFLNKKQKKHLNFSPAFGPPRRRTRTWPRRCRHQQMTRTRRQRRRRQRGRSPSQRKYR